MNSRQPPAVTLHRVERGSSPLANFGGRIAGYRLSSSNTSALIAAGKRFRGGADPSAEGSVSAPVPGPIIGDGVGTCWLALPWSQWTPIEMTSPTGTGLYRLRRRGSDELLYVGQGRIGSRIHSGLWIPANTLLDSWPSRNGPLAATNRPTL